MHAKRHSGIVAERERETLEGTTLAIALFSCVAAFASLVNHFEGCRVDRSGGGGLHLRPSLMF